MATNTPRSLWSRLNLRRKVQRGVFATWLRISMLEYEKVLLKSYLYIALQLDSLKSKWIYQDTYVSLFWSDCSFLGIYPRLSVILFVINRETTSIRVERIRSSHYWIALKISWKSFWPEISFSSFWRSTLGLKWKIVWNCLTLYDERVFC